MLVSWRSHFREIYMKANISVCKVLFIMTLLWFSLNQPTQVCFHWQTVGSSMILDIKTVNALFEVPQSSMHAWHPNMRSSKLEKCAKWAVGETLIPLVTEFFISRTNCKVEMYHCMILMIAQKNIQNRNIWNYLKKMFICAHTTKKLMHSLATLVVHLSALM